MTPDQIIDLLKLEPLPGEGGFFRETYKSIATIPASALPNHAGQRAHSTQIYYMLRSGSASKLHRVKSDEVFHHYMGASVTQLRIDPQGNTETIVIGSDLAKGERPQAIVPANWWQGAILSSDLTDAPDPDAFALLGCTVSPGFEWDDFELIQLPQHEAILNAATTAHAWAPRLA